MLEGVRVFWLEKWNTAHTKTMQWQGERHITLNFLQIYKLTLSPKRTLIKCTTDTDGLPLNWCTWLYGKLHWDMCPQVVPVLCATRSCLWGWSGKLSRVEWTDILGMIIIIINVIVIDIVVASIVACGRETRVFFNICESIHWCKCTECNCTRWETEEEEEEKKGNCKLTYLDMMTGKEKCFIIRVIIILLFVLWWSVCTWWECTLRIARANVCAWTAEHSDEFVHERTNERQNRRWQTHTMH